ncbi:hypothetical protein [Aulosira sp. FACHB-615]|uniref:hypothetical protein n=1 Tax=Aulosira sp. FACHB-615 TaxID=2692777 RepID=UPI001684C0B2|nr:hypothetical protein [Aulosira sp. FACHB-615]MBD2492482.1 hypothetical protein [Aulosira sp. FACHB-615]
MRYAIIENNQVVNVVLIERLEDFDPAIEAIASETANIGDIWDGANFVAANNSQPLDWVGFNNALLVNEAYNRAASTTLNQQAKNRMEAYAIALGTSNADVNLPVFALLWNQAMEGVPLPSKPSIEEVDEWRAIALASKMSFTFNDEGLID